MTVPGLPSAAPTLLQSSSACASSEKPATSKPAVANNTFRIASSFIDRTGLDIAGSGPAVSEERLAFLYQLCHHIGVMTHPYHRADIGGSTRARAATIRCAPDLASAGPRWRKSRS